MVAIYVRKSVISTDPSMSIETQISKCKDYLKGNDYSGKQEVFVDDGYSGKNTLRPKFQELMDKVEMGLVEVIIVYRLDRISRNVVDFYAMYGEFKKHKIVFISCMEKFGVETLSLTRDRSTTSAPPTASRCAQSAFLHGSGLQE